MLADALHNHRGALRASLMEVYGLRLDDALEDVLELADLMAWLPAGCALWRAFGGPAAISEEVHAIQMLDYSVRVLDYHAGRQGKGKKPQPPKTPPFAHEKRAEDAKVRRKAEALVKRQRRG